MNEEEARAFQLEWLKSHPPKPKEGIKPKKSSKPAKSSAIGPPKKGPLFETEVDSEIDLHGCAVDEALAQIGLWLDRRYDEPHRLRVIHGRSAASPDSIRSRVRRNCDSVWRHRLARHFPEKGNPGATILVIKPG